MKIPKEIKKMIKESYKHRKIANDLNEQIRQWMDENNLTNDSNIDYLIDTIELSNGTPETLIEFLETNN
jgi:aconitase B